jgi:hypothetical protein
VYNGTTITGLAGRVTAALKGQGFSGAAVNKSGWHGSTVGETTVFYAKESQAATAAAIVKALGSGKARLSASDAANGGVVVVAFSEPK